jgi:hypothetical protein
MREIPVCTDSWNGKHGEVFIWHNPDSTTEVTISEVASPWPFTLPSPIQIPAGAKRQCGLGSTPGRCHYNSSPCTTKGNPKTVIIA